MEIDDSAPFFNHQSNWDDLVQPRPAHNLPNRRAMQNSPHQGAYARPEMDSPLNALHGHRPSPQQHVQRPPQMSAHNNFASSDGLDMEQQNYDLLSSSSSSFDTRYRPFSSTPSLSNSGAINAYGQDMLFSGSSGNGFSDAISPLSVNPGYEHSIPSSYNGGNTSPISPPDSASVLHRAPYTFSNVGGISPTSIENGASAAFNDLLDHRTSPDDHYNDFNFGPSQSHFSQSSSSAMGMRQKSSPEIFRHVAPQATHGFKIEQNNSNFPGGYQYNLATPQPDLPLRLPVTTMGVDETLSRMKLQSHPGQGATDLQSFIRPYLEQYMNASNRIGHGERAVIVMSSKVAQKSYGTEKRFLCPPPTAIMIGNSWWSDVRRRGEEIKLAPPRAVISISGEPAPQESSVEWAGTSGKTFDVNDPPSGTTYIGRCVGKQLFISDVDEKRKKVEALVKIMAPPSDDEPERIIGTFSSRPIKVISKPSKKRQSAKNLELCINHGSTISLFHRLRSQTVSTKYLCVSGSGSSFKGSDGAALPGVDARHRNATPSFVARTASWDPFVIYIVDVNKPAGGIDVPPPPPPQPDYPSPPPNAITFTNNGSQIPVYYNQTVVLQCLTSGVVSPVLIIRKVDHATVVVGGGLAEGAKGVPDSYCPSGEVCGDPVSQLHKIAFEVYDPAKSVAPPPGSPGQTGSFLSCMGEKVNTYRPVEGRTWTSASSSPDASPPGGPDSPLLSTPPPAVAGEYFVRVGEPSIPPSPPDSDYPPSSDGGRVKRGKRNSVSSTTGPIVKGATKGRRRQNSQSSTGSGRATHTNENGASSGAVWQVDIGETSVWTIVGTDQVRYNFYIPPVLFDQPHPSSLASLSFPIPSKPVTPIPGVVKYLMPDRAAEAPKSNCAASRAAMTKPNPLASKSLTVYGENFSKADPVTVFFGAEPSPHVEIRCTEVLTCLPPENALPKRTQILLVRGDGVVFPSSVLYP